MTAHVRRFFTYIHPSAFLLAAQLLFMILYAAFDGSHIERALISAFSVLVLGLRLWVVERSPASNWIAWIIAVPTFVLTLLSAFIIHPSLLAWSSLLEAIFYFYVAISLIAYMLGDYDVTVDEIFAAGATFTLLAWGYAHLYFAIQSWDPGSFLSLVRTTESLTFIELLFLSFTNLSAAGLSDVLPVTNSARVLLMLEQFTGVGYVAVVVSRLVGLTIQRQARRRS